MKRLIEKHQQSNGKGRGKIQFGPEAQAYIQSQLNFIPGMNTNSNVSVQQTNRQVRQQEKIKKDNPKTKAEGSYRNIERRRKSGKTKDQEDTERDIKLATQPTWRTDVADALHYIGTGLTTVGGGLALASNPITTGTALVGGMLGGRAVDKVSQKLTGKNWAENVQKKLGLQTPTLAEFTNPGYFIGGGLGLKGKGALDQLIRMDMPRFGYKPTTQYYFKPGYAGINFGNPIGTNQVNLETHASIPIMRLIRNLRGTFNSSEVSNVIGRLTRSNPELRVEVENGVPLLQGPGDVLLDLQSDLNNKLAARGVSRLDMIRQQPQNFTQQPRGTVIDERAMNSNAPMNRTRTPEEVEKYGRYKKEDIVDQNGQLKVDPFGFDRVKTGAHGDFINTGNIRSTPQEVFEKLVNLYNSSLGKTELNRIRAANPRGRSGIVVHTHEGDLSVDSHRLALMMEQALGKEYIPMSVSGSENFVQANNLGYKNLFAKQNKWQMSDELSEAIKAGRYNIGEDQYWRPDFLRNKGFMAFEDSNGSLIIKDASGKTHGYIPALEADETLEIGFNAPIRQLNKYFGTNIKPAYIATPSESHWQPQWTFNRDIMYPNQQGIILKKGGNIVKKFKNRSK